MQEHNFRALLKDESFVNYCLKSNRRDIEHWETWIRENPEHRQQLVELKQLVISMGFHTANGKLEESYHDLKSRIAQKQQPEKAHDRFYRGWLKYAAAVVIFTSVAVLWYNQKKPDAQQLSNTPNTAITPGGNKAMLTLADGLKISLADAAKGQLKNQAGIIVTKTAEGEIVYTSAAVTNGSAPTVNSYNSIETPPGGQYKVILPDGSKAWLNAASSLKYPTNFAGHERRVLMTGEVYFEIAKNKHKPFLVVSAGQEIAVLGTHFNVNAYTDEPAARTTLLEGSVRMVSLKTKETVLLKPGQSAELLDHIAITQADIDKEMAWKNGDFIFKDETLISIMRKVARWYNVDVAFQPGLTSLKFDGMVSRSRNISAVLNMIASTGKVHFKTEGRRITVMK